MFVGFVEPAMEREVEALGSEHGGIRDRAKPWRP